MKEPVKDGWKTIGYIDKQSNGTISIYDDLYRYLGYIRREFNWLVAYDNINRRLGYYDEINDCTCDQPYRQIGKGNLLMNFYFNK